MASDRDVVRVRPPVGFSEVYRQIVLFVNLARHPLFRQHPDRVHDLPAPGEIFARDLRYVTREHVIVFHVDRIRIPRAIARRLHFDVFRAELGGGVRGRGDHAVRSPTVQPLDRPARVIVVRFEQVIRHRVVHQLQPHPVGRRQTCDRHTRHKRLRRARENTHTHTRTKKLIIFSS